MNVELLGKLRNGSIALDGSKRHLRLRRGRLDMVSPDSQATACLPSGRNSTYRPVQISATGFEARLVIRLITGETLTSCAKALGCKYETLRGQLKSVFEKTKTHRQPELVLVVIRALDEANLFLPNRLQPTEWRANGVAS